jgi:hypothetical protein
VVKLHVAARGEEGESLLDGALDVSPSPTEERAVSTVEAELPSVSADEVENSAERLSR